MERKYLYCYLEFQKIENRRYWKRLMNIPWYIIVPLAVSVVLISVSFILVFVPQTKGIASVLEIISLILSFVSYYLSDRYIVSNSASTFDEYVKSRERLNRWFTTVHIESDEDKKLLISRLKDYVSKKESDQKAISEKWDKWLQTIAVPVVLSIITTVITKQNNVSEMLATILVVLLIAGTFYGVIYIIRNVCRLPAKKEINQMQCFIDDLQSTLDMKRLGWLSNQKTVSDCQEANQD